MISRWTIVQFTWPNCIARANISPLELHRKREIIVEVFKIDNNILPRFKWELFEVKYL